MLGKLFGTQKKTQEPDHLQSLYNLIRDLLDDDAKKTELNLETQLEDIGFDSIKYIHLFLSLEDIIKIDLEEIVSKIDLSEIKTIKDISDLIEKLKNGPAK